MKPAEDIDKLIKKLRYKAGTGTDERILGNVLQALDKFEKQKSGATAPNIRRTIMKSPVTKLAAAAVIIIAVLVVFNQFGGSTPAFADVIEPFLTARTATFKATVEVEGGPTQTGEGMFMEPGRMRQTSSQGTIVINDLQQGKMVILIPPQNRAIA